MATATSSGKRNSADGGTFGQVATVDTGKECEARQHLRAVVRTTSRQHVDHDHVREGEDKPKEHGHSHNGGYQWHSDLEMMSPESRTVHRRSIVNVLRDGTQTGHQDDRCQGQQPPDVHGNDAPERQIRFPQPHDAARRSEEAEACSVQFNTL